MKKFLPQLGIISTLILSSSTWAQLPVVGSVVFEDANAASSVPTLSGLTIVAMALILAAVAYRVLKQKGININQTMVLALVAAGAFAFSIGGVDWVSDANAKSVTKLPVDGPGTMPIALYDTYYVNTGTTDLRIKSIKVDPGYSCDVGETPDKCDVGMVLESSENCSLYCSADSG